MLATNSMEKRLFTESTDLVSQLYKTPSLEGVAVIGVQHLFECTYEMFKTLNVSGLDLGKVFLLGKCYSSPDLVIHQMKLSGIHVCPQSSNYDSHKSYDAQFNKKVATFLKNAIKNLNFNECKKLIILDDGGHLINYIHKNAIVFPVPVVAIEQTSSGYNSFKEESVFQMPIFNVARSLAKRKLETPFIIEKFLYRLKSKVGEEKIHASNVLILGNGTIGQALYGKMKESNLNVCVFDTISSNKEALFPLLSRADIIIGCTGTVSLPRKMHRFLKKGVILASISSSDREFDAVSLRKNSPKSKDPYVDVYDKENDILLLQSGFPLNFGQAPLNMPFSKVRITISLLMAAIYECVINKKLLKGILQLSPAKELKVIENFRRTRQSVFFIKNLLCNFQRVPQKIKGKAKKIEAKAGWFWPAIVTQAPISTPKCFVKEY